MSDTKTPQPRSIHQHMSVHWRDIVTSADDTPAVEAPFKEKTTLVGRVGSMFLACGTSAWRVRTAMNRIARKLGMSLNADIGLTTIIYTCIENDNHYTQTVSLPTTGVNTRKLMYLELFVDQFQERCVKYSVEHMHQILDRIDKNTANTGPLPAALAAGLACCAFTFLLGGGPVEMLGALLGAGAGHFIRRIMLKNKISLIANVAVSVAAACSVYVAVIMLLELLHLTSPAHHAGYICAMLFIIPGFPLITGGLDLAKLDLRSGIERINYAGLIISIATLTGGVAATLFRFNPEDFEPLGLAVPVLFALRIIASFVGVYGFSIMFNSTKKMALVAGIIGACANVLRLTLIDAVNMPAGIAAFIGALTAGLLASLSNRKIGVPRISITVPSIVIMVPGMYMYKAIYYISINDISAGGSWLTRALLIVIALPLGLVFARFLTDPFFRHCS